VENILSSRRWTKADNPQVADLVIINTCSVRATAETRIFGRLGFFTGLKKVRAMEKDAKVKSDEMKAAVDFVKEHGKVPLTLIVMGCMAERLLKTLQKDWPCIDYVVGTFAKNKFGTSLRILRKAGNRFR